MGKGKGKERTTKFMCAQCGQANSDNAGQPAGQDVYRIQKVDQKVAVALASTLATKFPGSRSLIPSPDRPRLQSIYEGQNGQGKMQASN